MSDFTPQDTTAQRAARRFRNVFAVVLSFAILIGGGWFVYSKANSTIYSWRTANDYLGAGAEEVSVTIPKGATITQIGGLLVDAKVIKTVSAFKAAAAAEPRSAGIQAGSYKLKTQLPAASAIAMLLDPRNLLRKRVTIPEGLRLTQQLAVIAKGTGLTEDALKKVLATPKTLGFPEFAGTNPEGILFPDTYEVADVPDATTVLKAMVERFDSVTAELNFEEKAAAVGLTPYQALIIASIIEEEVFRAEDRPKVARVILNRLKIGMPLQLDSTVLYALGKTGKVKVSIAETKTASPYNTYMNKGLPPGPIAAPGLKALEAAVNPASGNWLYWVTVNLDTGETLFEDTYAAQQSDNNKLIAWCKANPGKCQ